MMDLADDLRNQVSGYYQEKIGTVLFLHTDKSIYIPNEHIWFKAYLLDNALQHEVLHLRLLNERKEIVLQKQFPIYDIRSNGELSIPATMVPGRYRLIAYTDKMISFNPENVFVQQIEVIKDESYELKAEALFTDSTDFTMGKKPEITVSVTADDRKVDKARGTYKIITSTKRIIFEGKFVTQPNGMARLSFTYPLLEENEEVFLQCKIINKDQSKELHIRLPKTNATFFAKCFPEGGNLVNGISNQVLIVVTDAAGQPLASNVVIEGQKGKITTRTNMSGLAVVTFTPDITQKYRLTVNGSGHSITTDFPVKIEPAGYVLQLKGTADQPLIIVKNKNMPENVVLLGRTLTALKMHMPLTIKSGDSVQLVLPKNDSLNHILDLGLFSDENRLLAERLVYVPAQEKYRVIFNFDKTAYKAREKVRAEITVVDAKGNKVESNLSIAVVAKHTLDPTIQKRITETDLYALRHYRTNINNINELNNALIREEIGSGNWAEVMDYQVKGKIRTYSNAAGVSGQVISRRKKKIDVKALYLLGKSAVIIPVNPNGTFSIPAKDLITERGKPNYLIVNSDFSDRYDLQLKDYSADFDIKLMATNLPESLPVYGLAKHSAQLSAIISGKILKEVVIVGKGAAAEQAGDFSAKNYYSKTCSDYVCFYNILNCKNHPEGMPPVEGGVYILNGSPVRYHGCTSNQELKKNSYTLKTIDLPQAFYLPDYASQPVSSPELQSTVFWEPNLYTQAKEMNSIEFYTSDINGEFTLMVQGLTINGLIPIFGKAEFKVISKMGP